MYIYLKIDCEVSIPSFLTTAGLIMISELPTTWGSVVLRQDGSGSSSRDMNSVPGTFMDE